MLQVTNAYPIQIHGMFNSRSQCAYIISPVWTYIFFRLESFGHTNGRWHFHVWKENMSTQTAPIQNTLALGTSETKRRPSWVFKDRPQGRDKWRWRYTTKNKRLVEVELWIVEVELWMVMYGMKMPNEFKSWRDETRCVHWVLFLMEAGWNIQHTKSNHKQTVSKHRKHFNRAYPNPSKQSVFFCNKTHQHDNLNQLLNANFPLPSQWLVAWPKDFTSLDMSGLFPPNPWKINRKETQVTAFHRGQPPLWLWQTQASFQLLRCKEDDVGFIFPSTSQG